MASKIYVLKLKDVIKTAVFAILGIIIIAAIIAFFSGSSKSAYNEGTYNSEIILYGNPVELSVTVSKDEIESISLEQLNETQEVFYPTFSNCIDEISQQCYNTHGNFYNIFKRDVMAWNRKTAAVIGCLIGSWCFFRRC